jgi:DNA replication licensing factor MCM3
MAVETGEVNFEKFRREFRRFIEDEEGNGDYKKKIQHMLAQGGSRLQIDLNDLRTYDEQQRAQRGAEYENMCDGLLKGPAERLPAWEAQLKALVEEENPSYGKDAKQQTERDFYIGIEGSFGANHVSPRELRSAFLAGLVNIEGIVTKAAQMKPKVVRSVHYCPATQQSIEREYRDATSFRGMPTGSTYPTKDDNGNLLETEFGLSKYSDHQKLIVQEMPERAPPGQLPCAVEVTVSNDLCDLCKPGDRVQIAGVYRALPSQKGGVTQGTFKTLVIGNSIKVLSKQLAQPVMSDAEIENIKKLAQEDHCFETLSASLAPSIYGHTELKQALLLLLLGGCEKNLENGGHIRGDINMLMIGDPSTAKSQMLRAAMNVAPLAISTTGRGSSGVGLTAAVTADAESGERRLEAGAMVLADRGMVCIDEFDKMSDADRVAIHEVMEQQTVTIAKAGMHASLNARCSVLAAANPIYGTYDRSLSPIRNIGMPDSLLSRFDLLFVVLDHKDEEVDRAISDHVLRIHRYCPRGQEGQPMVFVDKFELEGVDNNDEDAEENSMYQRHDRLLNRFTTGEILNKKFLKKYIHYAKTRFEPEVTQDANDKIVDFYTELRGQHAGDNNTLPVTVRTLETVIRLSSAHAKCRLSNYVEEKDVAAATVLMRAAIFSETSSSTRDNMNRRKGPEGEDHRDDDDDGAEDEDNMDDDDDNNNDDQGGSGAQVDEDQEMSDAVAPDQAAEDAEQQEEQVMDQPDDDDDHPSESPSKRQRTGSLPEDQDRPSQEPMESTQPMPEPEPEPEVDEERTFDTTRDAFAIKTLVACFRDGTDRVSLKIGELLTQVNADKTSDIGSEFNLKELMPLMQFLMENGRIMLDEWEDDHANGKIYLLV